MVQAHEISGEQADQGVSKAQAGKGQIKKLAREQGQVQGKVFESQSSILGLKRLGSQISSDGEEKVFKRKKCGGLVRNPSNDDISAMTAV